jgi:hypothetical protein
MPNLDNMSERDLLVQVHTKIHEVDRRLGVGEVRMNDHSRRIRILENWRWFLAGGIGLVAYAFRFA